MEPQNFNYIPPPLILLLSENHRLSNELSAAKTNLRHLTETLYKLKAEKESQLGEVYKRMVEMEAEVKGNDGLNLNVEMVKKLGEVMKLRLEKMELEEKLEKVRGDLVKKLKVSDQVRVVRLEIEKMKKEIERGREVIEHEKRVHASNIKQTQSMNECKLLMAAEIKKLQVEVGDARKRARAAAAAETASIRSSEV